MSEERGRIAAELERDQQEFTARYSKAKLQLDSEIAQFFQLSSGPQPGPWTLEQAVLAWMGFDIRPAKGLGDWAILHAEFDARIADALERLAYVYEAVSDGDLQEPISRRQFVEWAGNEHFDVPAWMVAPLNAESADPVGKDSEPPANAERKAASQDGSSTGNRKREAKSDAEKELARIKALGEHRLPAALLALLPPSCKSKGRPSAKKASDFLLTQHALYISELTLRKHLNAGRALLETLPDTRPGEPPLTHEEDDQLAGESSIIGAVPGR